MKEHWRLLLRCTVIALASMTMLLLAACTAGADRQRVDVGLSSFGIALSTNTVKPGKVTFTVKNNATDQTHEFVVVQTERPADQIPINPETHLIDEKQVTVLGEVEDLDSGAIKPLTLALKPGRYVLLCNLATHYQSGMHAEFSVTP